MDIPAGPQTRALRQSSALLEAAAQLLFRRQASAADALAALADALPQAFETPAAEVHVRIQFGAAVYGRRHLPGGFETACADFTGPEDLDGCIELAWPAAVTPPHQRDQLHALARMIEARLYAAGAVDRGRTLANGAASRRKEEADFARDFEFAMRELAESVSVRTGHAYQESLVRFLSSHFGLDIALIGELDAAGENVVSIAIAENGKLIPNLSYALAGTPCHEVIESDACFYDAGIQRLFPDDRWFEHVGAQGYAGVRLVDTDGKAIGIISAVSRRPLPNLGKVESLFKLAAARASAELDRMRKSAAVEESERRYALVERGTADGLWDLDLRTRRVYYSPRVAELLGIEPAVLGDNPEAFWARVHPNDILAAREARHAHLHRNQPFDVQFRVRHADGSYRWFRSRGRVTRDNHGEAARFTGNLSDITEGRRHQQQLTAENAWLAKFAETPPLPELLDAIVASGRELFDDSHLCVWLLDAASDMKVFPAIEKGRYSIERARRLLMRASENGIGIDRGSQDWPGRQDDARFEHALVLPVSGEGVIQRVGIAVMYPAGVPQQPHERRFVMAAARLVRLALDRLRKEADLQRQRLLFENLFQSAPEAMVILDHDDRVLDANTSFTGVFQYTCEEVRGRPLNDLVVPPEFAREAQRLSTDAMRGATVARDSFRRRKDGTLVPVSILGAPVTVSGMQASYFAIYRDQSNLYEATQKLDHQSRHDQLTGLPNRYEFERRLQQAMTLSAQGQGSTGVLYFDLDQFKVINDTSSHARGDELLNEVVRRVRELVPLPHLLARLGGDEFGVLLINGSQQDCENLAQRIRAQLGEEPFRLGERTFSITASFGVIAVQAGSVWSPQDVLSLADSICYLAKERGRNRIQIYDPADMGVMQRREEMDWISRINEALLEQRFQLQYQRIVALDGDTAGQHYEILLRMIGSGGDLVPPSVFIPPAERYNLMPRIDRWVLETVFARLARMDDTELADLTVAINVSGNTLSDEGLPEFVARLFQQYRIPAECICFEITETAAIANFEDALGFIDALRQLGCKIALDDFGSGLSSFRYLKQIAPDYLKIDGSFVREIARSQTDYSMVEAINRIGKTVGIRTIAEFVEDAAVLDALRRIGVDFAQGYGIHRPEPWPG